MEELNQFISPFFVSFSQSPNLSEIALTFIVPLILSFLVSFTYQRNHDESDSQNSFIYSLFIFSLVTAFITLIIGNNIARAFGLVGALSLIRFRTAIKNSYDTVFLFWSLAVGTACGSGFYIPAAIFSVFLSILIFLMNLFKYGNSHKLKAILSITIEKNNKDKNHSSFLSFLKKEKVQHNYINQHFSSDSDKRTIHFAITVKDFDHIINLEKVLNDNKEIIEYKLNSHEAHSFL